jgi:hypothetical protein
MPAACLATKVDSRTKTAELVLHLRIAKLSRRTERLSPAARRQPIPHADLPKTTVHLQSLPRCHKDVSKTSIVGREHHTVKILVAHDVQDHAQRVVDVIGLLLL